MPMISASNTVMESESKLVCQEKKKATTPAITPVNNKTKKSPVD
jgi:hypothetical protein